MKRVIWKIEGTWSCGRHRPLRRDNTERNETDRRGASGPSGSTCYWHFMFYKTAVLLDYWFS